MSIVAVHGPNTFGSKAVAGSASAPLMATVNPTNGLLWDFKLDGPTTRLAADFAWTFPPNGTPSPQNVADPTVVTYATAGSKTAQLVVTGAGTGATPYPAAGTYTLTVNAVAGTGGPGSSLLTAGEEDEDEEDEEQAEVAIGFDPAAHTVAEVEEYADEHPDQAQELLDAETAGKNRTTLVNYLASLVPFDPGEHSVTEVIGFVEDNPETLDDVIEAEEAGKARVTLLTHLESMRDA